MSEKTILDEVFDWFHKWWHGEPEQTQHEGTSTTDEAGETTEVDKGGKTIDETIDDRSTEPEDRPTTSRTLPRDKGVESA